MFSPIEQFDVIPVYRLESDCSFLYSSLSYYNSYDSLTWIVNLLISISRLLFLYNTQTIMFIILTTLLVYLIVYFMLTWVRVIPTLMQLVFELIYKFVIGLIHDQLGEKGYFYFPFLFFLFIFILQSNLFGLIPFGISITSYMIFTFTFSLTIWFSTVLIGFSKHKVKFLKIFVPEVGWEMVFILIIIELLSYVIRAFSLALRLSANITAGHTLLHIIAGLNLGIIKNIVFIAPLTLILLLAIMFLELGVAFVQSYVFLMLSCIYINDAMKAGH